MTITHFPHGILATPNLPTSSGGSVSRYPGIWTSQIFFVDGSNGSDSNDGTSPDGALATIGQAISLVGVDDTIYIRPKTETQGWSDLDPRYASYRAAYVENVDIARFTKAGLSIIGTGNGHGCSGGSVTMAGAATADCTIDIHAGFVNIENIQFGWRTQQTTSASAVIRTINGQTLDNAASHSSFGTTINNCWFDRNHNAWGTILIASSAGHLIQNCQFDNCLTGIYMDSSDTTPDGVVIRNNSFCGGPALIDTCIVMADVDDVWIENNIFGFVCPTHGATNKYINAAGTVAGHLIGNYFADASTEIATHNTLSNIAPAANWCRNGQITT